MRHKTGIASGNKVEVLQKFNEAFKAVMFYLTSIDITLKEGEKDKAEGLAVGAVDELKTLLGDMHYSLYGERVQMRETKGVKCFEWGEVRWGEYVEMLKEVLGGVFTISITLYDHFYNKTDKKKAWEAAEAGYKSLLNLALVLHNAVTGEGGKDLIIK